MKKIILTISLILIMILSVTVVYAQGGSVSGENIEASKIIKDENGNINYKQTSCLMGLPIFINEINEEYEEFMSEHMSSPDLSTNLLKTSVEKFNAYRKSLLTEYNNYSAKVGAATSSEIEKLSDCFELINTEIDLHKDSLRNNFSAAAKDRKSLRLKGKYEVINTQYKDLIHFPFSQFMAKMKSFSTNLPCYLNQCV